MYKRDCCFKIRKSLPQFTNEKLANFLWDNKGDGRHHWVRWKKITKPLEEGELGTKDCNDTMDKLQYKLAWKFIEGTSLWSRIMREKYGHPLDPWKEELQTLILKLGG